MAKVVKTLPSSAQMRKEKQKLRLLYLHNDDCALAVLGLDVHAVEFVVWVVLVAFALQQLDDVDRLVEENGDQAFEHSEVGLVAQYPFGSPVETNQSVSSIILFYCANNTGF